MARFLRESDVRAVLDMAVALERVEAALRDLALGAAADTPRVRTHAPAGTLHVLQASAPALGLIGFKYYFTGPGGKCSYVHLVDVRSGKLAAIVESGWMGMMRTGAASGIAARHMAAPRASIVGQIGAGSQAAGQLEAVCAALPIRQARVHARDRARLEAFCAAMAERLGIEVVPAESGAAAVDGAHVVNVITNAASPVLQGAWLQDGQHVNAAGSNSLTRRELDLAAVERCRFVAVDSRGTARAECGDLLPAVERGLLQWDRLAELGEVIAGRLSPRAAAADITLYESHGMGIQDLYVAERVLALARERGLGIDLPIA